MGACARLHEHGLKARIAALGYKPGFVLMLRSGGLLQAPSARVRPGGLRPRIGYRISHLENQ